MFKPFFNFQDQIKAYLGFACAKSLAAPPKRQHDTCKFHQHCNEWNDT